MFPILRQIPLARGVRGLHTSVNVFRTKDYFKTLNSPKRVELWKIKAEYGDSYAQKRLPTQLVLESLKNMQAVRVLASGNARRNVDVYQGAWKNVGELALDNPDTISMGDIESVLTPESGVAWRLIGQLLHDGKVPELEELDDEQKASVLFSRVHDVGSVFAKSYAKNGARTLEDLAKATGAEYGRKISKSQRLAIEHFEDMEKLIPRSEVEEIGRAFGDALRSAGDEYRFEIMGSYRRGASASSDVDIVVTHPDYVDVNQDASRYSTVAKVMDRLFRAMVGSGVLFEEKLLTHGIKKVSALTRAPGKETWRQIDIRLCPTNSFHYMLVGNTGDAHLMKILRARARSLGLLLNEYGMGTLHDPKNNGGAVIQPGTEIHVDSEQDIFERLELPYLQPAERSFKSYGRTKPYSGLM